MGSKRKVSGIGKARIKGELRLGQMSRLEVEESHSYPAPPENGFQARRGKNTDPEEQQFRFSRSAKSSFAWQMDKNNVSRTWGKQDSEGETKCRVSPSYFVTNHFLSGESLGKKKGGIAGMKGGGRTERGGERWRIRN